MRCWSQTRCTNQHKGVSHTSIPGVPRQRVEEHRDGERRVKVVRGAEIGSDRYLVLLKMSRKNRVDGRCRKQIDAESQKRISGLGLIG